MSALGWIAAILIGSLIGWAADRRSDGPHRSNLLLGIAGACGLNLLVFSLSDSSLGGWYGQFLLGFLGALTLISFPKRTTA